MTHDGLIDDLAAHLKGQGRLVWRDMQMGPSGSPRPDVWSIQPSYVRPEPMSYEVKATRSDYLADVTAWKWQSYLPFSSGVIFAYEKGLISRTEIPNQCGLIERGARGWRMVRRPILNLVVLPQETCLKLLIDGVRREGCEIRRRAWDDYRVRDKLGKKFGESVAQYLQNRSVAEYDLKKALEEAEDIRHRAKAAAEFIQKQADEKYAPIRAELCEMLGMPNAQPYQLKARVEEIRNGDGEYSLRLKCLVHDLQHLVRVHNIAIEAETDMETEFV